MPTPTEVLEDLITAYDLLYSAPSLGTVQDGEETGDKYLEATLNSNEGPNPLRWMRTTFKDGRPTETRGRMINGVIVATPICTQQMTGMRCAYPMPHLALPPPTILKLQPIHHHQSLGPRPRRPTLKSALRR